MLESFVEIDGEVIFCRHSPLAREKKTLLFIHGLGESSLCFREAFQCLQGLECNLLAPDNIGYGRSSTARDCDYSFRRQVERLQKLLNRLSVESVVLVGHSLGGMLSTLWIGARNEDRLLGLVNVEGNLFPSDATHSRVATEKFLELNGDFEQWRHWYLTEFIQKLVLEEHFNEPAMRRCFASMWFCRPPAFLANAQEIIAQTLPNPDGADTEQARNYAAARIPTCYYWGARSAPPSTVEWLNQRGLCNLGFQSSGHWPMIDQPEEFYQALLGFANHI